MKTTAIISTCLLIFGITATVLPLNPQRGLKNSSVNTEERGSEWYVAQDLYLAEDILFLYENGTCKEYFNISSKVPVAEVVYQYTYWFNGHRNGSFTKNTSFVNETFVNDSPVESLNRTYLSLWAVCLQFPHLSTYEEYNLTIQGRLYITDITDNQYLINLGTDKHLKTRTLNFGYTFLSVMVTLSIAIAVLGFVFFTIAVQSRGKK